MPDSTVVDWEAEVIRLGLPMTMKTSRACQLMDVGPTKLRELIAEGRIDGRKRDKDLIVATASILRFIKQLPPAKFA